MIGRLSKENIVAEPGFNRWRIPLASIAIHLCIGSVYAWSIFNPALVKELGVVASTAGDWELKPVVWIFSVAIVCLGLSAAVAGRWLEKVGPRLVGVVAAFCWGGGFLVGGLTSSRGELAQVSGSVCEGGVSGVLLAEDVPVITARSQSCMPIATQHQITACDENVLIELDGRPALEVFKEDIGELLARDLQRVAGYIFAALPIAHSDTGDYLVRNLTGIDVERQLLAIGETVETGQSIQFCRRDAEAAEADLVRMLSDLKKRTDKPAKGGLYYSCLARGPNMFGDASQELKIIERELGDVPLVGFFCNGEISHRRLYTYTGVLTLFT